MFFAAIRSHRANRPPPRRRSAAIAGAAASVVTAACVAGCSTGGFNGIYTIPLPGGANLGSHPYQVTAEFTNVGDLVPQSAVRVNNVAVGRVTNIYLPPRSWTRTAPTSPE